MRVTPLLILVLILFCSINTVAQKELYIPKVDQASKDLSFKEFRNSLIEIVKSKDTGSLISNLSPSIKLNKGDKKGIKKFKKVWKPDKLKTQLWYELNTILTNGGTFSTEARKKTFCAPYLPTQIASSPPDEPKIYTYHAIFGKDIDLREKPDLSSKIISSLSYNIVTTNGRRLKMLKKRGRENAWVKVKTVGGKEGFVNAKFVRSSTDYRACFEKIDGQWKMTALTSGK